jgi:hypothetical protein
MVDTFTSRVRLRKPEVGAKLDEWAPPITAGLNDGVADMIDQAMAQIIDIDVTVGNIILSTAEGLPDTQRPMFIRAFGTAGTPRDISVPDPPTQKMYVAENTADDDVTFKTISGSGVTLKPGIRAVLFVDEVLDDVFSVRFLDDAVEAPSLWITGTFDMEGSSPTTTLTYRYAIQGERIMFQLQDWTNITMSPDPGNPFSEFDLIPNTPALFPAEALPSFDQSWPVYMRISASIVEKWSFTIEAGTWKFSKDDFLIPIPDNSVMTLPRTQTVTYYSLGF